ncbi:MAG: cobyric acid synthase, partial [Lachnospiraceae bacterium]|nr:cobyric acid synthase [Lachnospiraceae bacterium]
MSESLREGLYTDDLKIGYDTDLIDSICINVQPGKIVTLIGPNGCGKTTLLKTLMGSLKSRGGVIYVSGKDRSTLTAKDTARSVSMVMTKSPLPELMTCREVIESGRYPYTGLLGRLSEEDSRAVSEAADMCGCTDISAQLFTNISDGQRQRVMLARAIAQEPSVLVLDEPTSYLDIRYKTDILTKIRALAVNKNIAVLMSVHEPETAMRLSDMVVALGEGQVLRIGTPREVFEEGFIRKLYKLGDADVGEFSGVPWFKDPIRHIITDPGKPGRIMIQGTMSNVGKSILAAGLCRIFAQDGYSVAPFKSQNMANNSFITPDGLEMGRAQVMQAECAGITPDVCMNPILLKPLSDKGSQVVVRGRVTGNMDAKEYFDHKKELIPVIMDSFKELERSHDIIVIEGAGSPAEINLKENDIVNMGLAKMLGANVLLAGDIDRGGVFAQLLGTMDLLAGDERELVKGLIINKFRGDVSLLEPGIRMLEDMARCP